MEDRFDMTKLLDLRKLTTAIADLLQGQLEGYLSTLQPLFLPQTVAGDRVLARVTGERAGAFKGEVIELLGDGNDPDVALMVAVNFSPSFTGSLGPVLYALTSPVSSRRCSSRARPPSESRYSDGGSRSRRSPRRPRIGPGSRNWSRAGSAPATSSRWRSLLRST